MQTLNTQLEGHAFKLIDETIAEAKTSIAHGLLQSFDDYRFRCGIINGLEQAKGLISQASSDIAKR
jgi:hypothetical protein